MAGPFIDVFNTELKQCLKVRVCVLWLTLRCKQGPSHTSGRPKRAACGLVRMEADQAHTAVPSTLHPQGESGKAG